MMKNRKNLFSFLLALLLLWQTGGAAFPGAYALDAKAEAAGREEDAAPSLPPRPPIPLSFFFFYFL